MASDDHEVKLRQAVLHSHFLSQRLDVQTDVCLQRQKKCEFHCCCDKYQNPD